MIKCFKCGVYATQDAEGNARPMCTCYPPNLIMVPEISYVSTANIQVSMISAAPQEPRDARDYANTEHLEHMSRQLEEHERICVSCSYLKQCGFKTRCVEYRNMQEIHAFWRKRVQA